MSKRLCAALVGLLSAWPVSAQAQVKKDVPPGTPVTITVTPAPPTSPDVSIRLLDRSGQARPLKECFCHTGAGNIDVAQPSPDTVVITMTGAAVAGAHPCRPSVAAFDFDLEQSFEVVFEKPSVKAARVSLEGRVIGLLRSHGKGGGSAEATQACATILAAQTPLLKLCLPSHIVTGGENLSINDHAGPVSGPIRAAKYSLHQVFHVAASHPKCLWPCKAASAEFAPDPALDPLWISYWEPFHGAQKKDFGFQITLKVAAEEAKDEGKKDEGKGESPTSGKADNKAVNVSPVQPPGTPLPPLVPTTSSLPPR
jgi:hypothetical protein